jgi:saccharopine dehydrogenase (NAD+, L-lysine-forming)
MEKLKIGIVRETKNPPDKRVPLTPVQCRRLKQRYPSLDITVQPSDYRCFSNDEYSAEGLALSEDLSGCEVLMGVKEVREDSLLNNRSYLFFSHTAKKQPYNRSLLQAVVRKGIRLIDYEYLTDSDGMRVVAFGRWAGVVGSYNGLRAYGQKSGRYELKPAYQCFDLEEVQAQLHKVDLGNQRIAVTGGGRVAGGALEILDQAGVVAVSPEDFLQRDYGHAIYTRLDPWHYARHKEGSSFEFAHFVEHPGMYENNFLSYAARTDLFIACHFWDPASPVMLTREHLAGGQLPLTLVADISCDIDGPIASTIRASTIADPFYGYDPKSGRETAPFDAGVITVMAVDNLPGELPRDASNDFGSALVEQVIPELLGERDTGMIQRASITQSGALTSPYAYLADFLAGRE